MTVFLTILSNGLLDKVEFSILKWNSMHMRSEYFNIVFTVSYLFATLKPQGRKGV